MIGELTPLFLGAAAVAMRVFAGSMLLASGVVKLGAMPAFEASLAAYRVLPGPSIVPAARGLPVIETMLGAMLFVPAVAIAAVPAAALLLLLFASAVALNLLRGRTHLDCGCGTGMKIRWRLVTGNVALAGLLLATAAAPVVADPLLLAGGVALGLGLWLIQRTIGAMAVLSRRSNEARLMRNPS